MLLGDLVVFEMDGNRCEGLIIGEMAYSNGSVFLLANDEAIGMPSHVSHLTKTTNTDIEKALRLRKRYKDKFPGKLKPRDI